MDKNVFANEIVEDCAKKVHFARQAFSKDEMVLNSVLRIVKSGIDELNRDSRVVCIDMRKYDAFSDYIRDILIQIFGDSKFNEDDTLVRIEEFRNETRESELCYQFNCVVEEDFSITKTHLLIVLEHFEYSKDYWTSSNFGWMRGALCDSQYLSILVLANERVNDISEEPIGSSPFYNIFEISKVD